jgi:hypothetical protein
MDDKQLGFGEYEQPHGEEEYPAADPLSAECHTADSLDAAVV